MNRGSEKNVGWLDWKVVLSMILFVALMLCSVYSKLNILRYVAIITALYGVIRTFAHNNER